MPNMVFSRNDSNFLFPKLANSDSDYHRNNLSGYYLNHTVGNKLR